MKKVLISFMVCFGILNVFAQEDVANSKDYYLLDRMPDFSIKSYQEITFDKHNFSIKGGSKLAEGKKFIITYRHNLYLDKAFVFPSRLQVLRNYSNAIKKAGGRVLYEASNNQHGYYSFKVNGKTCYIDVHSYSGKQYKLIIIEEEPMRQDIVIDAKLIKSALEIEGKIAIYGIYFDTGKAIVKEESKPALEQIAEFLKANPTINCWVVGHTDADGSFQLNSKLSLDRAKAIKTALETTYGVRNERLFAEGVGPLAPIATNATEDGKTLNRRVELVKK